MSGDGEDARPGPIARTHGKQPAPRVVETPVDIQTHELQAGSREADTLKGADLEDLCDATEKAIEDGGGFGWLRVPSRETLERYWQGVLANPTRRLFVARLDGVIAGSAQLTKPTRNNEAQAFAAHLMSAFITPWARGHGLARQLTERVEAAARRESVAVLKLDVRETQSAAIRLYDSMGYTRYAIDPVYARVGGEFVRGFYYAKVLDPSVKVDWETVLA